MYALLSIATILGGVAALWFFWDKICVWWNRRSNPLVPLSIDPSRGNAEKHLMSSNPRADWDAQITNESDSRIYKSDVNFRLVISHDESGTHNDNFIETWANKHPDPRAHSYWCDVCYGATVIERIILVAVDGHRAMLPLPKTGGVSSAPNTVEELDYRVAEIFDDSNTLVEYMKRSGLSRGARAA